MKHLLLLLLVTLPLIVITNFRLNAQFANGCDYDGNNPINISVSGVNGSAIYNAVLVYDNGAGVSGTVNVALTGLISEDVIFTIPPPLPTGNFTFHVFNYATIDFPLGIDETNYNAALASANCFAHSSFVAQVCTTIHSTTFCAGECYGTAQINIADPGDYNSSSDFSTTYVVVDPATGVILQVNANGQFTTGATLPNLNAASSPYEIYALNWNTTDPAAQLLVTNIVPNATLWSSIAFNDDQPAGTASTLMCIDVSTTPYMLCVMGPNPPNTVDSSLCSNVAGSNIFTNFNLSAMEAILGGVGGTWSEAGTPIATPASYTLDATITNPLTLQYSFVNDTSGCAAITNVNFFISQQSTTNNLQQICVGQTYTINGNTYSITGIYNDTLTSAAGCDSIVVTDLQVVTSFNTANPQTICAGNSYVINGNTYSANGIYSDTLLSVSGCDSVITTDLTVVSSFNTNNPQLLCLGDTYTINGNTYSTTGLYNDTLSAVGGCDSIITTDITIVNIALTSNPQTICNGYSYTINGNTYTTSGSYNDTLLSFQNCDSIVNTTLTVLPNTSSTNNQTICLGSSYSINGNTYSIAGSYFDTLVSFNGCDSIVNTIITISPVLTGTNNQTICSGSQYVFNGNVYTISGSYNDTISLPSGCDSVITTNLTVTLAPSSSQTINICSGGQYTFNGHTYTSTGVYNDTLTLPSGCDSLVITTINVNPPSSSVQNQSICFGGQYVFNGNIYSIAGTYNDTLTLPSGCDSVVSTILTVNPIITFNNIQSICSGGQYVLNGNIYTNAGTYFDTLNTPLGCDSLVITTLSINPIITYLNDQVICTGTSYNINGNSYTTTGVYNDTLTSPLGCDSLVITNLTVTSVITFNNIQNICEGDFITVLGNVYNSSGSYTDSTTSIGGCDSVIYTSLTVHPIYNINNSYDLCQGESILVNGNVYNNTGVYIDSMASFAGCDSVVTSNVVVHPIPYPNFTLSPLCFDQNAILTYTGSTDITEMNWNLGTTQTISSQGLMGPYTLQFAQAGNNTISVNVNNAYNCANDTSITFLVTDYAVNTIQDQTINYGEEINLNTTIYSNTIDSFWINWTPPIALSCFDCQIPTAQPLMTTNYVITINDENGCTATDSVTVYVDVPYEVYIPNAFSPNGDGDNDLFFVYGTFIRSLEMKIYNRWGENVFETNNKDEGWDGKFLDKTCDPAVFVYVVNIQFVHGEYRTYKGNITLVR